MRSTFFFLTFILAFPVSAQTFTDRSELLINHPENLLDDDGRAKHFSWSVSIADLDGNGLPDIHEPGILYLQQEDGRFVSSLPQMGITYRPLPPPLQGFEGRGLFGSVMADVDDDGFNELFIMDFLEDSSKVFANQHGLHLTEVSPGNGIDFKGLGQGGAFADFNGDGHLDFFFGEERGSNQLFFGDGTGSFVEVTDLAGISGSSQTYGVATADYDNDGDMDVFIAACAADASKSVNLLFRNNGDGTFEEVGAEAGINDNGNAWGVNFFDYDRDGWLDIHLANMMFDSSDSRGNANKLYRNLGDGTFEDISASAGIEGNDNSYGSSVADFNNDGWPDIWVANFNSPASIWMNNGDGTFTDGYASSGLSFVFYHLSAAVADLNGDGWVDVYTGSDNEAGQYSRLLFNEPGANHWLTLRLIQDAPNRRAVGARINLWSEGTLQIRDITAGDGFVSQNMDQSAHFGLDTATVVDSVVVRWPDGQEDRWTSIGADQAVTLAKGGGFNEPPEPFRASSAILTKRTGKRVTAEVAWEPSADPEGATLTYTVAVRNPDGDIVHVSDALSEIGYTFDADTTGFGFADLWEFAVTASDGIHVRRSLNVGVVPLGADTEQAEVPAALSLQSLWPQPATNRFTVEVNSAHPAQADWKLIDMQGRTARTGSVHLGAGPQSMVIETGGLGAGMYILRLASRTAMVSRALVLVNN